MFKKSHCYAGLVFIVGRPNDKRSMDEVKEGAITASIPKPATSAMGQGAHDTFGPDGRRDYSNAGPVDHGSSSMGMDRAKSDRLRIRNMMMRRRVLGVVAIIGLRPWENLQAATPTVEVWKDPACGCCQDWVRHMQANGFAVTVRNTGNAEARSRLGMPVKYGSCHTATVGAYVLEGHVPAREVQRLLISKPRALGLAVPGMPIGSPGMDGTEYKGRKDPFHVLLVNRDGSASTYGVYP